VRKFHASDGNAKDGYGRGLSFSDKYITIGAFKHDVNTTDDGSAYIYPVPSSEYGGIDWAELQTDGNGWGKSTWFGWVNTGSLPWLFSVDHGWLFFADSVSESGAWAHDQEFGWIYLESLYYPNLYSLAHTSWLFYYAGSTEPRWFYDYGSGKWIN